MSNNKIFKINWLNIVFDNEFQKFLNIRILKELSILSRLVRIKLRPKLFNHIDLNNKHDNSTGILGSNYNVGELSALINLINSGDVILQSSFYIEKVLNNNLHGLKSINKFVFSLYFNGLFEAGYYLLKIFECCNNLTSLKLESCNIPYSTIKNLRVSFPNLEGIELKDVLLVYFRTNNSHSEDYIFPVNLNYLGILRVRVIELEDLSRLHTARFDNFFYEISYTFILPKTSIPSLKILNLNHYENEMENGLEEFLDINPNLELLKIDVLELDRTYNFNSLNILVPRYIDCFNQINLPTQEGIKELIIDIEDDEEFENAVKLCELCPNLEKLEFSIPPSDVSYQQSFDSFLIPVLFKLPKVKTLTLRIFTDEDDVININGFPHIESIIFYSNKHLISNIMFDNSINLKNIEIRLVLLGSNSNELPDELVKMRNNHKNWDLKLFKRKIKGFNLLA